MLKALGNWLGRRLGRLRIAVVTPVGPGHAALYAECRASVQAAWRSKRGPFSALSFIAVDDSEGKLGRSRARNIGIDRALQQGADWLFFLDADDLMVEGAFGSVAPYVGDHDAVWGLILGLSPGAARPHLRIPQIISMNTFDDLLLFDPFLTLQMGHFVRTPVAHAVRLDEAMDAGEDFDYYLRAWSAHRCVKVAREFFINRHARHSTGPRSASAEDWGATVRGRQRAERAKHNVNIDSPVALAVRNARIAELQKFCRQHGFANKRDCVGLSLRMPFHGDVEVHDCEGDNFVLHTENDDVICAQLAWAGEYQPFAAAIWQAAAGKAGSVLDIGAGNGFYALLASRASPGSRIFCFDPAAENAARLRLNIELNGANNIELAELAISDADGEVGISVRNREGMLPVEVEMVPEAAPRRTVHSARMDSWLSERGIDNVALVRICAGANVMHVMAGMARLLGRRQPDLLIDLAPQTVTDGLEECLRENRYRCYRVDDENREIRPFAGGDARVSDERLLLFASTRSLPEIGRLAESALGRLVGS